MAEITYTWKVPYHAKGIAGTRYMIIQAPYSDEAMKLVEGMVPGSNAYHPEELEEHNSDRDEREARKRRGGFLSWLF
jgi:hypothetical protein